MIWNANHDSYVFSRVVNISPNFLGAIFHTISWMTDHIFWFHLYNLPKLRIMEQLDFYCWAFAVPIGALKTSPSKLVARGIQIEWHVKENQDCLLCTMAIGIDMGTNILQNILFILKTLAKTSVNIRLCTASMCNSSCHRYECKEATTDLYLWRKAAASDDKLP